MMGARYNIALKTLEKGKSQKPFDKSYGGQNKGFSGGGKPYGGQKDGGGYGQVDFGGILQVFKGYSGGKGYQGEASGNNYGVRGGRRRGHCDLSSSVVRYLQDWTFGDLQNGV